MVGSGSRGIDVAVASGVSVGRTVGRTVGTTVGVTCTPPTSTVGVAVTVGVGVRSRLSAGDLVPVWAKAGAASMANRAAAAMMVRWVFPTK